MNWKKILINFIDNIPDEKLQGFKLTPGTLWKDNDFRLNMQGLTTAGEYNLQIQINAKISVTTLKPFAPNTAAGPVLVPQSVVSTSDTQSSAAKSNEKNGKPAGGKPAADQNDVKNAEGKSSGDAKPVPDPAAIRKAFKATIRPLAEIVGPGQQGQKGQKGQKGKK
ncbi:hypothetical protein PG991_009864 [Apiospora marii]|uniref:Uncharacterized protein n=1 Tax=Apiospora marii TaxID=335849 RepID=A0ABR1RGU4_9PEZI